MLKTILIALLLWSLPGLVVAQFTTLTNETRVNTTTAGNQEDYWWSTRVLAVQPDGGSIIAWIDRGGNDGSGDGIFAQRFNSSGAKVGSEFLVNTTTAGDQFSPSVAVAPDGSFIIAWEGPGTGIDVWAQRYTKDGVKIGFEFLLNTTTGGSQRYPEIQFYPDGTFVAGFVDGSQTVLQRFNASARPIGIETRISSGTGDVVMDGLCVRPDNTLLMVWTSGGDVYGQIFSSTLVPIGSQTRLNTYLPGTQEYAVARVDGLGNFIVTWQDQVQDGSGMGAYYRRYDSNFNPLMPNELLVTTNTTGDQFEPQVAVEPGGRFIIAWSDKNNRDGGGGTGESVWFREFDANGNTVGVETRVNQSITGDQSYPIIDMNASGRFVIDFQGNGTQTGQIDSYGIFARAYQLSQTGTTAVSVTPSTTTASDIVTVTMTLTNPTSIPNVVPNPLSVSGTNDVFAILVSGPTPASATVGTTPVTFTWTYRVTAKESSGLLSFGGNARGTSGQIFPYAESSTIAVNPSIFLNDITAPNLVNDSNSPDAAPKVFTIGAKITNPGLNDLNDIVVYLGDGTTPGTFPVTTMTLAQTNNTYQGSFSLTPLANAADCIRPLITLGASKPVIAGRIDFNRDGVINASDNGVLSNGKTVIGGLIDVNNSGTITAADDINVPPGVYTGYREPAVIDGYVDSNRDGVINASDNGTYGGETRNLYWQVVYAVKDAYAKATYGSCGDIVDDLRYDWVIWATGKDGAIIREDLVEDYAKVRCQLNAGTNKISPSGGFISGVPPRVIAGLVDINSSGSITATDNGTYYGKPVIAGKMDMNNSGTITAADNGLINGFPVIAGYIDVNSSGGISSADDGILVQPGQTVNVTVNNAAFGTIGSGFDENMDGLPDYDFWYQPVGETAWPNLTYRLIDIQSDITGTGGGSNPLSGITTHFDNEPYLSRLSTSGGFNANYTYTFLVLTSGNGFLQPYQQAASGTGANKYCGDYGTGVNIFTGAAGLAVSIAGTPTSARICDTITWSMSYQNVGSNPAGDPGSGNGVTIDDSIPANTSFVSGSATSGGYPCTIYYSTDNGTSWTSTQPPAADINRILWHISVEVPGYGTGNLGFRTTVKDCPPDGSNITNNVAIRLGTGGTINTATAVLTVSNPAPVITTCPVTRNILGCNTNLITGPNFSAISTASSISEFGNGTNQGVATDDCGITSVTYSDSFIGDCASPVYRTWVVMDACSNTSTCIQTINFSNAVGDLVFYDTNGNGARDPGEAGVSGVVIQLYKLVGLSNVYVAQTSTDGSGIYSFTGLDHTKVHYLRVYPPANFSGTSPDQIENDNNDSDMDPLTNETNRFRVYAGEINLTIDIGIIPTPPPGNLPPIAAQEQQSIKDEEIVKKSRKPNWFQRIFSK